MVDHPEPSLDELLWTAAAARILLPPAVHVQCPPNLSYDEFPRLLDAGIDDWGGFSPVTVDHVNPERRGEIAAWSVRRGQKGWSRSAPAIYPSTSQTRRGSTGGCPTPPPRVRR